MASDLKTKIEQISATANRQIFEAIIEGYKAVGAEIIFNPLDLYARNIDYGSWQSLKLILIYQGSWYQMSLSSSAYTASFSGVSTGSQSPEAAIKRLKKDNPQDYRLDVMSKIFDHQFDRIEKLF